MIAILSAKKNYHTNKVNENSWLLCAEFDYDLGFIRFGKISDEIIHPCCTKDAEIAVCISVVKTLVMSGWWWQWFCSKIIQPQIKILFNFKSIIVVV